MRPKGTLDQMPFLRWLLSKRSRFLILALLLRLALARVVVTHTLLLYPMLERSNFGRDPLVGYAATFEQS
jgi:hypothetical protein